MLTAMKLTGNIEDITAYHCRRENYYFKQGRGLAAALFPEDKGSNIISDEPLDYVSVRGVLASRLGFEDGESISEIDLSNLMSGRNRKGEKISVAHKVHAIDLTFSAPKSASIAGLALKDSEVIRAHRLAVLETMKEVERLACAQPRAGAKVPTGKMVWVQVDDGFSREKDPHLHTHCIVMNLTEHNGKIYALDGREILKRDFNRMFGAFYRAKLAEYLKGAEFGITCGKAGEWRLDKVPLDCERAFSTRRRQIVEAQSAGMSDLDAWRKTRKDKDDKTDKAEILKDWAGILKKFGGKTEAVNRKEGEAARSEWARNAIHSVEAEQEIAFDRAGLSDEERWQLALRRATETEATATKEELLYEYLCEKMRSEKWDGATFAGLEAELKEQVESGSIIRLGDYYTSWELARAEREYISFADDETGAAVSAPTEKIIDWEKGQSGAVGKTLVIASVAKQSPDSGDCHGRQLSPLQKEAAAKILSSVERLSVVQGDAGAGKTSMLKAVADIYKTEGLEVIGLCMQGVAAQKLKQETGVAAFTLKSYFSRNPRSFRESSQPRVIIFDEASMLDSRNAAKLFKSAKENGDKIILVGDRNQLESIAAGRVFERLCEIKDSPRRWRGGERKGGLIEMNENFRQRDERLREAVDYARNGRMKKSLDALDKRGDITEIPDRFIDGKNSAAERRGIIAAQYDKDTLIITGTQQARDELNLLIREDLKSGGKLKKEKSFGLARTDRDGIDAPVKMNIAEGEVIVFAKNEYRTYDIRNGERATITKLGGVLKPHIIAVETEDKRKLEIDTRKYKHIDYGYALTTYKAQGQTYDKVIVDADTSSAPALNDMRAQYVNITRARDSVKIFTDDKKDLKELAGMLEHKRDTLGRMDITLEDALKAEQRLKERVDKNIFDERYLTENRKLTESRGGICRARSFSRGRRDI